MATLVELTWYYDITKEDAQPRKVTVNLDLVKTIERSRKGDRTFVWFGVYGEDMEEVEVMETPATICSLAEGADRSGMPTF